MFALLQCAARAQFLHARINHSLFFEVLERSRVLCRSWKQNPIVNIPISLYISTTIYLVNTHTNSMGVCKKMGMERDRAEIYVMRLLNEYSYPLQHIQREFPYAFGRARYKLDIVVVKEERPYIMVEVKTVNRNLRRSVDQLLSYVQVLDVDFAVLTDGYWDKCYRVNRDAYETKLIPIPDIPSYGKTLGSIGKHSNKELVKAKSDQLSRIILEVTTRVQLSLGLTKEEAFKKVLKFLVLKVFDEDLKEGLFRSSFDEPAENVKTRINVLMTRGKEKYPNLFKEGIDLGGKLIKSLVFAFQKYSIKESMKEIAGSKLPIAEILGPEAYLYSTPRELVKMMIDLLAPEKGSTFIDPACGVGGLITEAASMGLNVTGIEMVVDIAQYAESNLALSGFEGKVINAESLGIRDDSKLNLCQDKFDYAAVVPPFGGRVSDGRLNSFSLGINKRNQNIEVLFLEHTIRFLRKGGKMAIVIPAGFLFGDSYFDARELLLRQAIVKAIITLPAGTFSPMTSIKAALLVLEKSPDRGTKSEDQVFVAIVESIKDFEKIVSSYKSFEDKKIIPKEDYVFITNLESAKQINPDYLKGLQILRSQRKKDLSPDWSSQVQLQNISRIVTGVRMKKVGKKDLKGEVRYVRAGQVNDLLLDLGRSDRIITKGDVSRYTAQSGDILMTRAGTVGRVALVQDDSVPIILGSNVLKISINEKTRISPEYLLAFLRSKHGQTQIEMFTGGSTIRAISVSGLRQIKIPIPSKEEQEKMASQVRKIIEAKKEAIRISNELRVKEEKLLYELNDMFWRT